MTEPAVADMTVEMTPPLPIDLTEPQHIITITIDSTSNITSSVDWFQQLTTRKPAATSTKSPAQPRATLVQTAVECTPYVVAGAEVSSQTSDNVYTLACAKQHTAALLNSLHTQPFTLTLYEVCPPAASHIKTNAPRVAVATVQIPLQQLLQCQTEFRHTDLEWQLTPAAQTTNTALHALTQTAVQIPVLSVSVSTPVVLLTPAERSNANELILQPLSLYNLPSYWYDSAPAKANKAKKQISPYTDTFTLTCTLPLSLSETCDVVLAASSLCNDGVQQDYSPSVTWSETTLHTQYISYECSRLLLHAADSNMQLPVTLTMKRLETATGIAVFDVRGNGSIDLAALLTNPGDLTISLTQTERPPTSQLAVPVEMSPATTSRRASKQIKQSAAKSAEPAKELPTLQQCNTYMTLKLSTRSPLSASHTTSLQTLCNQHIRVADQLKHAATQLQNKHNVESAIVQLVNPDNPDVNCPLTIQRSRVIDLLHTVVDDADVEAAEVDSVQQLRLAEQYAQSLDTPVHHTTSLYISAIISAVTPSQQVHALYAYARFCTTHLRQTNTAVQCLTRALQIDQQSVVCAQLMVCILVEADRVEQAEQYISLLHTSANPVSKLIVALHCLANEYDDKFAEMMQSININDADVQRDLSELVGASLLTLPVHATCMYTLASMLAQLGCDRWANTVFTMCHTQTGMLEYVSASALFEHAVVLCRLGDTAKAVKCVQHGLTELAVVGVSDAVEVVHVRAVAALALCSTQSTDDAIKQFSMCLSASRTSVSGRVITQYVNALMLAQRYGDAVGVLANALKASADDVTLWLLLSTTLTAQSKYIEANGALSHASTLDSDNAAVYVQMAVNLVKLHLSHEPDTGSDLRLQQAVIYVKHGLTLSNMLDCTALLNDASTLFDSIGNDVMKQQLLRVTTGGISSPSDIKMSTQPNESVGELIAV